MKVVTGVSTKSNALVFYDMTSGHSLR